MAGYLPLWLPPFPSDLESEDFEEEPDLPDPSLKVDFEEDLSSFFPLKFACFFWFEK